jgi:DNA replication protein DnaC
VKHWTKGGEPVAWLMHDQLVSAVLHSYDENSPRLHRRVVVDDMGRERKAEFADALCDLLDMQDRTILITSNLTTKQFKERYTDARLLDRLNDSCVAVRLTAPSMRSQTGGF